MGFLDGLLKRVVRSAVNEEVNKVERNITNEVRDTINENKPKQESRYKVGEKYLHFPQFDGVLDDVSEKKESTYERCTMDYYHATNEEIDKYANEVVEKGYKKMTNVRYEKDNEYIIIENRNNYLHLVFHIKF